MKLHAFIAAVLFTAATRAAEPTGCPSFTVERPTNPTGPVVRATDFGLSTSRRDNQIAINAAIVHCRKTGASKLVLAPGDYHCDGSHGVWIDGLKDFTLDGAGARLIFYRPSVFRNQEQYVIDKENGNFFIKDCLRTVLCNLKIDWDWERDPLGAFVRIVDKHIDEKDNSSYIVVEFVDYEKYPMYPKEFPLLTFNGIKETRDGFKFGQFEAHWGASEGHGGVKNDWISPNRARIYPNVKPTTLPVADAYFQRYSAAANRRVVKNAKIGAFCRLSHYYYGLNCFNLESNHHLTLEDIDVWSCRGLGYQVDGNNMYWQNIRVNFAPPPGIRPMRPFSSTADANHITRSNGFIKFIDCRTSMNQDDIHNFHDRTSYGKRENIRELLVTQVRKNYFFGAKKGDPIELRLPDYAPTGWKGTITKVEGDKLFLDRDLPGKDGDEFILFDRAYGTDNILLKGCRYEDYFGRLLMLGSNVTIEDCLFARGTGVPLNLQLSLTSEDWAEGMGCTNIVVRGCRFEDTMVIGQQPIAGIVCDVYTGIAFGSEWKPIVRTPWNSILSDILIENCTFKNPRGHVAYFKDGENITFRGNTIYEKDRIAPRAAGCGSVLITGAKNVRTENNKFLIEGSGVKK